MIEVAFFLGGYLVQLGGTVLLLSRTVQRKSVYGLSFDSQICYLFAAIARSVWTFRTRLVQTRLAHVEMVLAIISSIAICWSILQFRKTNTKQAPPQALSAWVLAPTAFLLASLIHPGRGWIFSQVLVAFTIYLEALALLPQLSIAQRVNDNDGITSLYMALLIMSRIVRLAFWISLYLQGDKFIALLIADLLHSILCGRYLLIWIKTLRFGGLGLIV